jgi:uncharacterized protein (TIGR00369 family)
MADNTHDAEVLAHISAADVGGLGERMGMEWLETTPERVVARIPVAGNTQPFGLLHGGASAVLAESAGSVLANLNAGSGRFAVGIELSCSHHRSAREGWVTAVATPLSVGRTLVTSHIDVRDDQDRPVCTARLTCYLRDAG